MNAKSPRKDIVIFERCSPLGQRTMTRSFSDLLTCLLGSVASGVVLTPSAENVCSPVSGISSPDGLTVQTGTVTRLSTISTQISGTLHSVIFPMFRMTRPMLLSMHPSQTMMFCSQVSHASRSVLPVSAKRTPLAESTALNATPRGPFFFDVARIIRAKQPAIFVLENVKNLKSHDKGNTFRIIMNALDELGYDVADSDAHGAKDPKIIDGKNFRPQHRERIVLVGFRRDLKLNDGFSLSGVSALYPSRRPTLRELLDAEVDSRYILSPKLWEYLYNYAKKHQAKGNGFGYGLVDSSIETVVCRTLSARYYRDGSEILLDRGWDFSIGEKHFNDPVNLARRPRRLTPRECARLMGFEQPGKVTFRIPVSDTQAYRQFGNSVIVDVFAAVASLLRSRIETAVSARLKGEFEAAS